MPKEIQRFMEREIQALRAALGKRQTQQLLDLLAINMCDIESSEAQQKRVIRYSACGRASSSSYEPH
jgi:hypothetical protein